MKRSSILSSLPACLTACAVAATLIVAPASAAEPGSAADDESTRGAYELARDCMVTSVVMEQAEVTPKSSSEKWGVLAFVLGEQIGVDVEKDSLAELDRLLKGFETDPKARAETLVLKSQQCDTVYAELDVPTETPADAAK